MEHSNQKQSGVVLITTILFIAVFSTLSIFLIDSSYTLTRKTQQHINKEQLQQFARAVEDFGIHVLYWDNWFDSLIWQDEEIEYELPRPSLEDNNPLGYDPHNDSLFESWSIPTTPEFIKAELDNDYVTQDVLYITDLNRFFNINNLHFANSTDVKQAFDINVGIFKELLRQIVDKDTDTDKLINEIIDWLDHDNDSRSAILLTEEDVYRRAGASYRPANRPINSIGELKHVLGMTPQVMSKLSNFVVALPVYAGSFSPYKQAFSPYNQVSRNYSDLNTPELTKININTCPPELLTALFAVYNNQSGLTTALERQGYFQSINKPQALNFRNYFSRNVHSGRVLNMDKPEQEKFFNSLENSIDLVASEYSQFFLIESFFQNKYGLSFNHETLVFKNKTQFNLMPIVIQRQFDWLPLHSSKYSS